MVRVIGPINDMRAESEAVLEHTGITWQVGEGHCASVNQSVGVVVPVHAEAIVKSCISLSLSISICSSPVDHTVCCSIAALLQWCTG